MLQRILPDRPEVDLPAQAVQLHQDHTGIDIGDRFFQPQAVAVGAGQELPGVGAGHK